MKPISLLAFLCVFVFEAVAAAKAPPLRADYQARLVAEDVYVIHGPMGVPTPENQGFMNNPGFVITEEGVVIVDPGSSAQVGERVLQTVRRITDKPVVAVFNTHVHGDHWLGNQAIAEAWPQAKIYAHPKMIERAKAGAGKDWLKIMLDSTAGATAGTGVTIPNAMVDDQTNVVVGDTTFRILHDGQAHTDNDIMIFVPEKEVIFLGDNAGHGRLLRLVDGNFKGNIAALNRALETGASVFVPGHGQSGGPEAATEYRDYLQVVLDGVKQYFEEDLSDFEIKPKLLPLLGRWKEWVDFGSLMGSHVSLAYLEVEAEEF